MKNIIYKNAIIYREELEKWPLTGIHTGPDDVSGYWTYSKPYGLSLWWHIKAAWQVLRGRAMPVEWK